MEKEMNKVYKRVLTKGTDEYDEFNNFLESGDCYHEDNSRDFWIDDCGCQWDRSDLVDELFEDFYLNDWEAE